MRILLDLDEVLADFVGGACEAWGVSVEEVRANWPIGVWDCVPPLGRTLNFKMTNDIFWSRINGSERFWTNLRPLPFARAVVELVSTGTDDWHIVSAPSRCASSYAGKVRWLKAFFGETFDRFALTPHKHIFACQDAVLIDDRDSNVSEFIRAGGKGIVFPRHHNSNHLYVGSEVDYLRGTLNDLVAGRPG